MTSCSRLNSSAAASIDPASILFPHPRQLAQQVCEPGPAPARRGREVGAAVERLEIRREEDRHRPAAGTGGRLDEGHVDAIHVRALLAIDLDRHEVVVEQAGDLRTHERLVLHDVAPVARRVADRQEDRLVFAAGSLEGLVAPWIPVHGVAGMLKQVGAVLARETIHGCHGVSRRRSYNRARATIP